MEDPGLFNAILSHYSCGNFGELAESQDLAKEPTGASSLLIANTTPGPSGEVQDPMEALQFRMDAMNLINQRLESPESALNDYTIGAVASLGLWEVSVETFVINALN